MSADPFCQKNRNCTRPKDHTGQCAFKGTPINQCGQDHRRARPLYAGPEGGKPMTRSGSTPKKPRKRMRRAGREVPRGTPGYVFVPGHLNDPDVPLYIIFGNLARQMASSAQSKVAGPKHAWERMREHRRLASPAERKAVADSPLLRYTLLLLLAQEDMYR